LDKNQTITYEQNLGNKKQVWSIQRVKENTLEYKTKGESRWNFTNVTEESVIFTQMVDAIQSFKGNKVIHFNFNNCTKGTEKKYRIFISAYNEMNLNNGSILHALENKNITMEGGEIEKAKAFIIKQLNLHAAEIESNEKKLEDIVHCFKEAKIKSFQRG
jgi:hypothetical protein